LAGLAKQVVIFIPTRIVDMCGRFVRKIKLPEAMDFFKAALMETEIEPSFNIAPRQPIAVVMDDGKRKIVAMQWGLIPHWSKDEKIANKLSNARSETIGEKPSFKNSFKKFRCLIIADGFYEWQGTGRKKKPFFICRKDEKPFGIAGLFDKWINPEGKSITTCTIVTTEANEIMKPIHHRMPVIIEPENYDLWLNPHEIDIAKLGKLLKPCNPELLKAYEVGLAVNAAQNTSEDCIAPVVK
jgi:putative SOS response-associated peptidase YedK